MRDAAPPSSPPTIDVSWSSVRLRRKGKKNGRSTGKHRELFQSTVHEERPTTAFVRITSDERTSLGAGDPSSIVDYSTCRSVERMLACSPPFLSLLACLGLWPCAPALYS